MTREEAIKILSYRDAYGVPCGYAGGITEALDMAIKALEQEPSGDLISKKSAKNAIYKVCLSEGNKDIFVKILDEINKLPSIEQEPSVEIVKTEESNDNGTKYLNINVSDDEVKRNPNIVRLCSDVGMLEYAKPSGDAISRQAVYEVLDSMLDDSSDNKRNQLVSLDSIADEIAELPSVNPQEPKTETVTEFADRCRECGAKYGKLLKKAPNTGHWSRKTKVDAYDIAGVKTWGIKCQCDRCDFTTIVVEDFGYYKFCPNCGAKMVEPQESEEV